MPGIVSREISDAARAQTRGIVANREDEKRQQELLTQQNELEAKAAEGAATRQAQADAVKMQETGANRRTVMQTQSQLEQQKLAGEQGLGRLATEFDNRQKERVGYDPKTGLINSPSGLVGGTEGFQQGLEQKRQETALINQQTAMLPKMQGLVIQQERADVDKAAKEAKAKADQDKLELLRKKQEAELEGTGLGGA